MCCRNGVNACVYSGDKTINKLICLPAIPCAVWNETHVDEPEFKY